MIWQRWDYIWTTGYTGSDIERWYYGPCVNCLCEAGETPSTCQSDCVVTSFRTKSNPNSRSRGNFFTVKATRGLTVFSFEIVGNNDGNSQCMVYTRVGDYQGYEKDDSRWELVLNKDIAVEQIRVYLPAWELWIEIWRYLLSLPRHSTSGATKA